MFKIRISFFKFGVESNYVTYIETEVIENSRLGSADVNITEALTNKSINKTRQPRRFNPISVCHQYNVFRALGVSCITGNRVRRRRLGRRFIVIIGLRLLILDPTFSVEKNFLKIGYQARWQKIVLHRRSRHFFQ